jgi:hypothetical protein
MDPSAKSRPDSSVFIREFIRPSIYNDLLTKTFGQDWLEWEPETLHHEIMRVFNTRPLDQVFEKIMALQTYLNTDLYWDSLLTFEDIVLAFGDRHVDPDLIQGCTPEELAYGIAVAEELGKEHKGSFSNDIIQYIRACHQMAGVIVYHPSMKFAQPTYPNPMASLVTRVTDAIARGVRPADPIDLDDVYQVQLAKTLDVSAYVDERLVKGMLSLKDLQHA